MFRTILLSALLLQTMLVTPDTTENVVNVNTQEETNYIIEGNAFSDLYYEIINESLETHNSLQKVDVFSTREINLYDVYSDEELELLFRVVEAEVTDGDVISKSHVASVIFNRLKEGWWDGDLTKSLMARSQFEVITNGRYKKVEITDGTILACEIAFKHDTTNGALFFDSTNGKSWANRNCEFLFRDDVGHDFFK